MFLSYLLIDTAANADRPRPGRHWVQNPYRVHQRLCMAFPSEKRKCDDPHFLDPFVPDDFQTLTPVLIDGHVHTVRDAATGFLFRIDALPATNPSRHVVTVQSAVAPNWDYAFHNSPEFLAAKPKVSESTSTYRDGDMLRFRLRANPTQKIRPSSFQPDPDGRRAHWMKPVPHKKQPEREIIPSRRVGITTPEEQLAWLNRKAEAGGFTVEKLDKAVAEGTLDAWKTTFEEPEKNRRRLTMASALFEGHLVVRDAETFRRTLLAGIGSAKGLGFGLLSVKVL